VKDSEQPDSSRNSSASLVEIVGLLQRRLICSGRKSSLPQTLHVPGAMISGDQY